MNGWQDRQLTEYEKRELKYQERVASGMGEWEPSEREKKALRDAKALRNVLLFIGGWIVITVIAMGCRHGWSISR